MTAKHELDHLRQQIVDVPGWLTPEEAEAIYELAKGCTGRGVIVEIGSWKGKSTICLGLGSRAGNSVPIYAVDPHADYRFGDFKENVERAGVADLVTPIASLSQDAAGDFEKPIELLFVDGSHEYELVRADFEQWVPKLVEGGWLAMHDTSWTEGPRRVANEQVLKSRRFRAARFVVGSTTVAQKVAANTLRDRLRGRYVLAVKNVFAFGSSALKKHRRLLPRPLEAIGRRILRFMQ